MESQIEPCLERSFQAGGMQTSEVKVAIDCGNVALCLIFASTVCKTVPPCRAPHDILEEGEEEQKELENVSI